MHIATWILINNVQMTVHDYIVAPSNVTKTLSTQHCTNYSSQAEQNFKYKLNRRAIRVENSQKLSLISKRTSSYKTILLKAYAEFDKTGIDICASSDERILKSLMMCFKLKNTVSTDTRVT